MQISAVAIFCFGLTVLTIGYIMVEVWRGEDYQFRKILVRNNNYRLDRVIHYVVRGLLCNIVVIFLSAYSGGINHLVDLFNSSGVFGMGFNVDLVNRFEIQLVVFSIAYFLIVAILLVVQIVCWRLGDYLKELSQGNNWRDKKIKANIKLDWVLPAIGSMLGGVVLAKLFPVLIDLDWIYYIVCVVVFGTYIAYKIGPKEYKK